MEIILEIADFGIIAAVIGLVAFLCCGVGKLFFVKPINSKYGLASLQGDEYDKAKAKATSEIKKICNAISIITGVLLLVPFYIFILGQKDFYTDILFWTNLFAIPNIAVLYYVMYQGIQSKNISPKVWLHKLVSLVIALFKYLKNLKRDKAADSSDLTEKLLQSFEIANVLTEDQKENIKKLLTRK